MPDNDTPDPSLFDDPTPEGMTPRQLWLHANFKLIALVLSVGASPVCAHFASGRVERMRQRFEREDRERKREVQLRIHRQKMRTTLVKEVVSIAKNADLNKVAHAYRIGLIAVIVMSNPDVFRLNMKDAKDKLDEIIKKMKVVHSIRKQLADAEKTEVDLQAKVKKYDKENEDLEKKLVKTKKKYGRARWLGVAQRAKWAKKVTAAKTALQRSQFRRLMYSSRLRRERNRRRMYAFHLRHTQRRLQLKMSAAAAQKKKSAREVKKLNGLLATLGAKASTTSKEVATLRDLVKKLTKSSSTAQATIQELNEDLGKLRRTNSTLRVASTQLAKTLAECKPKSAMVP